MSFWAIEELEANEFRVCRFERKADMEKWIKRKANKRRGSYDPYFRLKAKRLMSDFGNECVRIRDTRRIR